MVRCRNLVPVVLTAILFSAAAANAFVVQDFAKAISFNNYGRDGGGGAASSAAAKEKEVCAPVDSSVDYDEIAGKMLPKREPDKIFVDLRRDSATVISAKAGQTFFLLLPEDNGGVWHFEAKQLKLLNSKYNEGMRILELLAVCCGNESIFMDYRSEPNAKVTKSRILRLKVKKK